MSFLNIINQTKQSIRTNSNSNIFPSCYWPERKDKLNVPIISFKQTVSVKLLCFIDEKDLNFFYTKQHQCPIFFHVLEGCHPKDRELELTGPITFLLNNNKQFCSMNPPTSLGMSTSFGGSGMCLWAWGLRYVIFLQCKNAQCEKSNEALTLQTTVVWGILTRLGYYHYLAIH